MTSTPTPQTSLFGYTMEAAAMLSQSGGFNRAANMGGE